MKKIINYIIAIAVLLFMVTSCKKDVLDQKSVDSFSQDDVFSNIRLTKAFLGRCYDRMYGTSGALSRCQEDLTSSGTDETLCIHRPQNYGWFRNTLTPDALGYWQSGYAGYVNWNNMYSNFQNVNLLLANIDDVPIATATEEALIQQYKGEAYYIRATGYANLWLIHGGLVLTDEPFELGQDFLTITRSTLEETLDFILADIAQAMTLLPDKDLEQGRATKAACAALKARLLHFASGDLLNGKLALTASDPLVCFQGGSQTAHIQASLDAQKAIIDGTYGTFSLVGTTADPPSPLTQADVDAYADNYFNIFNGHGKWNSETIYATQTTLTSGGNYSSTNKWNGPCGYHNWGNNNPTEPAVRQFEMATGTPFVWDNGDGEYLRQATAAELAADPLLSPYAGREPRFYGTVLYHGAPWQAGGADRLAIDPTNRIQTGHFYDKTTGLRTQAGVDSRQGDIEAWNGTKNGYYIKKFSDPAVVGQYFNNTNYYIEFRYAEVLLNYAEACIWLGGAANILEGLDKLNMVRNRAGLPDRVTTDQAIAKQYLEHEKFIELFLEGERYWDLRRWLKFDQVVENVCEMQIKQYTNGDMEWFYNTTAIADERAWQGDEAYWIPIRTNEINKAPQLQQNPGY